MKLAIAMFATMFWFLLAMCLGFIGLVARNTWLQGQLVAYRALTGQPIDEAAEVSCKQRLLGCLRCCCKANQEPEGQQILQEQPDQQAEAAVPDQQAVAAVPNPQAEAAVPNPQAESAVPDQQAVAAVPDQQAVAAVPDQHQQASQQPPGLSKPLEPTRLGPPASSAHQEPPGMPPFFPLARNNSFRRKQHSTPVQDQDDYREWVQETARMLQMMQRMNAARKQSSDYDNLGDSMLTLDEAGTGRSGWKYHPAPPRPRQPSIDPSRELPPIPRYRPPTPERSSSLPRNAKANKPKASQQQLPTTGERDLSSAFMSKYNLWPEDYQ